VVEPCFAAVRTGRPSGREVGQPSRVRQPPPARCLTLTVGDLALGAGPDGKRGRPRLKGERDRYPPRPPLPRGGRTVFVGPGTAHEHLKHRGAGLPLARRVRTHTPVRMVLSVTGSPGRFWP